MCAGIDEVFAVASIDSETGVFFNWVFLFQLFHLSIDATTKRAGQNKPS